MTAFKARPQKTPALEPREMAALRAVSKLGLGDLPALRRLKKLGLVEERLGVWTTTQQGHIYLMFAAAR
jgi:hypothetical protein